jgi:UDP-N-acetylglucosamine:LPS N-acetylglucosamine transferase
MKILNKIFVFSALILVVIPVYAQGPPPATPIDGGLSLLLVAGGAYGVKKINDHLRK